jgi:hypothetical protein
MNVKVMRSNYEHVFRSANLQNKPIISSSYELAETQRSERNFGFSLELPRGAAARW